MSIKRERWMRHVRLTWRGTTHRATWQIADCALGLSLLNSDLRRRVVEVRRVGGRVAFRRAACSGSMKIVFGMSTIPSGMCGPIPAAD